MDQQEAIFAMGCFWCGESAFRDKNTGSPLPGIIDLRVGYAGGTMHNPTYENHTGHKEALKITFDPNIISYDTLLNLFWHNINPLDKTGQFCDKGFAYTSVIFYHDSIQKEKAEQTKIKAQERLKKDIVTEILDYTSFYEAEAYHQNYKEKNPTNYEYYRLSCGRDKRLKEIWE